ncbi:uncharacterized protein MICPUCDRAFT_36249 [Micromonas pusilla CCMP1545]|uniref:Origin recognition complex subunit 1 n=1 Tax=Micromonas pusilla (strain CCMP1545) TaxID=564608 RepID=C1N5G9_MICPC|nr:uncharacterized protein MICPUCDRAFT_36249 [Micromonas pusilla CCMP1545]EEH52496.1 predicted protein [Micromonas pusilla CCMP1545]|eukprot:XP_003063360.1 predicted protein [Micromonas pusilla CCMP1545]
MESDANPLAVALVPEKKAAKDAAAKTSTSTSTEKEREKKKREKDHLIQKDKKDAASKREKDPGAKKKKKKKSKASAEPAERRYWEQVKVDGEVFKRGDCAYVISDKTVDLDDETTDEPCTACGEATRGDDFMLECDGCLRGWHGGCLNPALTAVPEGEWHCPMCLASRDGVAPPSAAGKRTAVGEFLSGNLHLCRVECIWSERGRFYFVGRWFALPEETHAGRRADHARREVFLTNNTDENGVDCLLRPAKGGDDVFLCEYSYDSHFRRFRRRADWDDDDSDDHDGGRRWLTNHVPGGGGGVGGFKDDDDDYDGSDDDDDSSFLSRHLTASRRAAAKASGDGGVMGLGALAATKVDRAAPATALGRARVALSLSKTPGVLPCREREREQIFQFVQQSISAGADCKGRCLYISGVPGTGKTATVREVIRALKRKSRDGGLPRFNHVELNGLRLQTPAHAYSAIAEELVGERLAPNRACDVLTERFRDGKGSDGRVTVLVVDEVDLLVTRTQQLLYNLFDWPTHRRARLVILGIANTLDLPERLLPKIISRLGSNRVAFAPYKQAELKKIVAARLEEAGGGGGATGGSLLDAFESTAIELASRKVAGFNGCARRVLEMCRRAAELAEARVEARRRLEAGDASLITPADAAAAAHAAAVGEMFDSPDTTYVAAASRHERIFLAALVMELRRSGLSEVPVAGVMRTHENLCRTYGEPLPPAGCAAGVVCRLASQRLLLCDPGRKRSAQRVSLNMGRDDLVYALKETRVEKAIAAAAAAAARRERTGGGVGGIGGENGAGDAASAEGERGLDHGDIPWMKHLGL